MNSKDIITRKRTVLQYLSKRQLGVAFKNLNELATALQNWKTLETLNGLETNYKLMLHYLFEGVEDSQRDMVYRNLLRSLYEATDDIADELLKQESSNIYYERIRIGELRTPIAMSDFQAQIKSLVESRALTDLLEDGDNKQSKINDIAVKRERIATEMFNTTFISPRCNESTLNEYKEFIDSEEVPLREKCLLISALTLSLIHRFDSRKIQLLMHASRVDNIQIKARALVGLVIIMQMYDSRWQFYPELQSQLEMLSEDPDFKTHILKIILQLIRSRETEKISRRMTEEIIPEIMRINTLAGKKLNLDELMGDGDLSDKNPEWKKELEESGLANKLQEYTNLQLEGADVFHSTFASLKSFPFFTEMANWFLPFDPQYSQLASIFGDASNSSMLKTAIVDSNQMCNSDKYSFCLSLLQVPASHRESLLGKMHAESEDFKQLQREAAELNSKLNEEVTSNLYIQDLYRFFKLNSYRSNFVDIFALKLNFHEKESLKPLISDYQSLKQIAQYCFDKNYLKEALSIFEEIKHIAEDNIWQKIGYCKQMLEDTEGALEAYLHADLLTPNNSWILRRIANIYRTMKQPQKAIDFYQKALNITPDNMSLELNTGHCYLEMKDYDKALNSYFKVELMDEKNARKARRPIAWTALLLKKFELSQKYYKLILTDKPTAHDYLNAGHAELCIGNKKQAIEYYIKAAQEENDFDEFISMLVADQETLAELGVDPSIFKFLPDQIQYVLTNN